MLRETLQPKIRITPIVAQHPNPDVAFADVVQEMVRETVQIAPPESASVEVKESRILNSLLNAELKLDEEIVSKLA